MSELHFVAFPPRHADFCVSSRAGAVDLDLRATIDARHFGDVAETLHRLADELAVVHGAAMRAKALRRSDRLDCAIFLRADGAIVTSTMAVDHIPA
jgi:hypothetical protein